MTIAVFVCLFLMLLFLGVAVVGVRLDGRGIASGRPIAFTSFGLTTLMLFITLIAGWLAIAPEYRLYRANIEKRIIVTQAKAEADASIEQARGEVNRAKGTAAANKIVANSITEPYLRYLFTNNLAHTKNQVIYLPTEAGLPILEAQRGTR